MTKSPTRIELCGRLRVEWNGERLEDGLPGRQGRLLFAFLVLHRDRPVRRDELLEVLWPEVGPPASGDGALAPPLSRLRKALGPDRLRGRDELTLALPPGAYVDWEELGDLVSTAREHAARQDWDRALEASRGALEIADGGLLPGLEAGWIDELRGRLSDYRVEALETAALSGIGHGGSELPGAERAARAAIYAAPFRETAHGALIEALRAQGNNAEAMRAYEALRVLLREELGSTPGPGLVALHEVLLHARPAGGSAARAVAEPAQLPDRLAQAAASPLLGREEPLERLRAELLRAQEGQTVLVLITGDAGIGKTRLVAQLAAEASTFTVLYGRCDEEQLYPFGAWIEMISGYLAGLGDAELAVLLGAEAADLARLLPELGWRLPELEQRADGDPGTERRRLYAAVERLVARVAEHRPLLLALDDLHWADQSSLLLGRQLARAGDLGGVFLLGTYRDAELVSPHPLANILADLERERDLPRIHLEGLDETAVGTLMGEFGSSEPDAAAVHAIHTETDGNPFFVKQLARHLAEAGGGEPSARAYSVPAGVRDVIRRRVARLPEPAAATLEVAALIGRDFEMAVLQRVSDIPEEALLDVLDAAVRAALLVEIPAAPGRYSFAHAIARTTLEGELTATRRARLHGRIGEAIEAAYRDRLDPHLADLARHFGAAGPQESDRAVAYATRAAEQARTRLAYEEAVDLLTGAVAARERDHTVDGAELSRLLSLLAAAKSRTGDLQEARADFARAASTARDAGAPSAFARAALGHAGGIWERWAITDRDSVELLEEALALLPAEDSALRAEVIARLSYVLYFSGGAAERIASLACDAVEMARRLDEPRAMVSAQVATQNVHWNPGQIQERLKSANELVAAAERLGDEHLLGEAYAWRAVPLLELCRLAEADADLRRHAEIAERVQYPTLTLHRDGIRAMRALLEGRWADAERAAAAMSPTAERLLAEGEAPSVQRAQYYAVELLVLRSEQLRLAEVGEYMSELFGETGAIPGWRSTVAWAHAQGGEQELARTEIESLRPHSFAAVPRDANFIACMAVLSHVVDELQDAALAVEIEPLLRPYAGEWVVLGPGAATLGPIDYALGLLELTAGHRASAERHFARAVELSEQMLARPYLAHSKLGRSAALVDDDPGEAARLRTEALAIADELGMPRLLRDAERIRPAGVT